MKKIVVVAGLVGVIAISSVIFIKKQKVQSSETPQNAVEQVNSPNQQQGDKTNSPPINPDNTIMINPNIVSPEGSNRLPKIIPPPQATLKIGPPPEISLMNDCQKMASGNQELMRKCFESKVQANLMSKNVSSQNQQVVVNKAVPTSNFSNNIKNTTSANQSNHSVFK